MRTSPRLRRSPAEGRWTAIWGLTIQPDLVRARSANDHWQGNSRHVQTTSQHPAPHAVDRGRRVCDALRAGCTGLPGIESRPAVDATIAAGQFGDDANWCSLDTRQCQILTSMGTRGGVPGLTRHGQRSGRTGPIRAAVALSQHREHTAQVVAALLGLIEGPGAASPWRPRGCAGKNRHTRLARGIGRRSSGDLRARRSKTCRAARGRTRVFVLGEGSRAVPALARLVPQREGQSPSWCPRVVEGDEDDPGGSGAPHCK